MIALFLVAFVVLLCLGIPIAICLGGSALIYLALAEDATMTLMGQSVYGGIASFPMLAIPLFMLAGNFMSEGGLTQDLVRFARLLLGHVKGGLGLATILAAAIFAAISGSAVATAVAIGMVMIPAMAEAGYDEDVAAALTATAACMGPIIPPSIPFIVYGVIANVSIAGLFLGGVIPGTILGIGLMMYIYFVAKNRKYPVERKASLKEVAVGAWGALPALFMPVLIMGGILSGIFTPTEAAGVSTVYAFLVGMFFYKRLSWRRIPHVLLDAGLESSMVMLLLGLSEPFSWVIAVEQMPQLIVEGIGAISTTPWVVLGLVNVALLIIGIPIETVPGIVIVAPMLVGIAEQLGINPIHMGIVACFNLVLGLITPPVGSVLFVVCGIRNMSLEKLSKAIWVPFFIGLAVLALITYIPSLTTYLPHLLLHK